MTRRGVEQDRSLSERREVYGRKLVGLLVAALVLVVVGLVLRASLDTAVGAWIALVAFGVFFTALMIGGWLGPRR